MAEEGQFNLLTIEFGSLCTKIDIAKLITIFSGPITMRPGAHYQKIGNPGVQTFGPAIRLECSEKILTIKPASYCHDGASNIFEMRPDIARLPKSVVRRMAQKLG